MSSSQLLNLTFNRICVFVEKSGFKIRNMKDGVTFYYYPGNKVYNYDWMWKNKKEILLGRKINDYDIEPSLFSLLITRYEYTKRYNIKNSEPVSEPISETTSNFIDVCRFLIGSDSIEELALKLDLMGI
jgi:hypothetical protein